MSLVRPPLGILPSLALALWTAGTGPLEGADGPSYRVVVESGAVDRLGSIVRMEAPPGIWDPRLSLGDREIPVQAAYDGFLYFVLESLEKESSATFTLDNRTGGERPPRKVRVRADGSSLLFSIGQSPALRYQGAPQGLPRPGIDPAHLRGGYLHPLWTPQGRIVTDDYPANHLHHHGVWTAWPKAVFQGREANFWETGRKAGTVKFDGLDAFWSGAVHGGFRSRHRLVDFTSGSEETALLESWEVRIYALEDRHVFDLEWVQECASGDPVSFPRYRYGGLGYRGHGQWDGRPNAFYLTGNGESDRIKGHATRAPWCHVGGLTGGAFCGTAILCHPGNFRAPQPMRIHPDEPFFCYAPSQAGDWEIRPGEPYLSRYRLVVFDGRPDKAVLDRMWQDYARPVRARIE